MIQATILDMVRLIKLFTERERVSDSMRETDGEMQTNRERERNRVR